MRTNKPVQKHKIKEVMESTPLIEGNIRLRNIRDARRFLSKVILKFNQRGIKDSDAKTICYLLNCYVNITRDSDFENRLISLEKLMENEK
jgi:hypothetical protein